MFLFFGLEALLACLVYSHGMNVTVNVDYADVLASPRLMFGRMYRKSSSKTGLGDPISDSSSAP